MNQDDSFGKVVWIGVVIFLDFVQSENASKKIVFGDEKQPKVTLLLFVLHK